MNKLCIFLAMTVGLALQVSEIYPVATEQAPKVIGPYSQAVRAGDYLFVSGQLPIDPKTGSFSGEVRLRQSRSFAILKRYSLLKTCL